MRGSATYAEDMPVEPGTDGIVVQADADSAQVSDYPCVNCGECVRICPVKIPVNMLVRFLEARLYEDAAALRSGVAPEAHKVSRSCRLKSCLLCPLTSRVSMCDARTTRSLSAPVR